MKISNNRSPAELSKGGGDWASKSKTCPLECRRSHLDEQMKGVGFGFIGEHDMG
jgi:hypothetical protein